MTHYSKKLKESIIQKMMSPNNVPILQLVRDTGIPDATLYPWRKKALSRGISVPGNGKNPDQWSPENQLAVIIETAALNQTEMAEYCRKRGLFAEQIQQWKAAFISGVSASSGSTKEQRKALAAEQKKTSRRSKNLSANSNVRTRR